MALEDHAAVEAWPLDLAAVHEDVAGAGFLEAGQTLRMVVLPQPEWPMMQTNSPFSMWKWMSSNTGGLVFPPSAG